jgi:hypothetical protein
VTADRARTLGRVVQGVVLGGLLFFALLQMLIAAAGGAVFRYQGF